MQIADEEKLKKYGKSFSLLLVEDDPLSLEIYADTLKEYFSSLDTASNGKEALEKMTRPDVHYDLVVTDIWMPQMDGVEFIHNIRRRSSKQHIMVLTAMDSVDVLYEIINLGVDGILQKPLKKKQFLQVVYRVFVNIMHEKLLRSQIRQLNLFSKETVELKSSLRAYEPQKERKPKIEKVSFESPAKLGKYETRKTIVGGSSDELLAQLDYVNVDKMDIFQDKLIEYEVLLCKTSFIDTPKKIKENFSHVANGLNEFVEALNLLGHFSLASNAASHFIQFLNDIKEQQLKEDEKCEMAIDSLLYLLQDINEWIIMVFIKREAKNINYFDASFANSCLEIEMLFQDKNCEDEEEDSLEFF